MGDIPRGNRPLSPHLQVYRLPISAVTSIMNRITGHAMLAGVILIVWWLVAAVLPVAFLLVFFAWPVAAMLWRGIGGDADAFTGAVDLTADAGR